MLPVDLHIPKKMLSNNGLAMEQSTFLQNQFPVEEGIIVFKFKLCIYYIYITYAYCDYIKKYIGCSMNTLVTSLNEVFIGYWVMNNAC